MLQDSFVDALLNKTEYFVISLRVPRGSPKFPLNQS